MLSYRHVSKRLHCVGLSSDGLPVVVIGLHCVGLSSDGAFGNSGN